jgi:hypothetical protein
MLSTVSSVCAVRPSPPLRDVPHCDVVARCVGDARGGERNVSGSDTSIVLSARCLYPVASLLPTPSRSIVPFLPSSSFVVSAVQYAEIEEPWEAASGAGQEREGEERGGRCCLKRNRDYHRMESLADSTLILLPPFRLSIDLRPPPHSFSPSKANRLDHSPPPLLRYPSPPLHRHFSTCISTSCGRECTTSSRREGGSGI